MGDHRAGSTGPTATVVTAPPPPSPVEARGRRVARHAAEQRTSQPYVGRRVAQVSPPAPTPAPPAPPTPPVDDPLAYTGRRVARRDPVDDDLDDVSGHLVQVAAAPTLQPYSGRRAARALPLIAEPLVAVAEDPVLVEPVIDKPVVVDQPVVELPVVVDPPVMVELPVVETTIVETTVAPAVVDVRVPPKQPRPTGRRVASRRTRIPSLPLLAGVAVLAISTCGALQAMHPDLAGAGSDGRLSPASALSGSSAVGSANLLGGRGSVVSRDSARTALSSASGSSLRAAADAQAKQRDATLAALRGRAEKRAAQIKLHQWVLPVQPGVYHLTARFGQYSYLWSNMHTGLDFAAPTGTPIMAVAGGTISDVGYSGAFGNRTIETLPDGTQLWYCHQNEFGTSVGATVKPGQVIGYVGSTGNVTGPHLHLEVHPGGGDAVDPYTALIVHGLQP
jgi:murein DD-endopeptidase MepM/ murein hydrolase activator NlpD